MLQNITIRTKLIILSAVSLLGLAFSISYISLEKAEDIMIKYEMDKLSTVEVTKHGEIKKYFKTLENFLLSLASDQGTKEAFTALKKGFYKIDKESDLNLEDIKTRLKADYSANYLPKVNYSVPASAKRRLPSAYLPKDTNALNAQYIFITDNTAQVGYKNSLTYNSDYKTTYMQAHKKYHPTFNKYLSSFELYDIFLVDLKGNIIYTVFKEKDFATNLKTGVYATTNLSSVYKKALLADEGELAFEDFASYEPSYNQYASFIATPIYKDGKKSGVLIFQLPVKHITNIMQFDGLYERAGLGKSGECYLVGDDYMMRTNSRFQKDIDNRLVQELGSTIGVLKIKTKSTQSALQNPDSDVKRWIIKDYRGIDVLSVYHTIDVFHQASWAIVAEIDKDEILAPTKELQNALIFISLIILFVFILVSIFLINLTIGKPLEKFQDGVLHFFEFLKGNSDTTQELDVLSNDEIGKMAKSVNQGIAILKEDFEHKESEQWIRDGMSQLNAKLVEATLLKDVVHNAIVFISEYLKAGSGVVYIFNSDKESLEEYASYAHIKRTSLSNTYSLGEGIVGQVALQRSPIELVNAKDTEIVIQSATINEPAHTAYTYPLVYQETLYGVIEVASLKGFTQKEIEFLNATNRVIATAISTSLQTTKVQELLEASQLANNELKQNEEKLQEANDHMKHQQKLLEMNNAELEEQQQQLEIANQNMEEQQQQLEEANANMEEQQQQLQISEQNLKTQNDTLESAKEELEQKAQELEISSKYKSEFLANMSHELRTPLNAIILLSQLLEKNTKKNLSEDDVKKAKTIFSSGNELLRLINDVLDLSKVESGKMEVIVDEFDSSDFLETIENLFEHPAKEKGLELKIIDEYKGILYSDRDRISQIVRNLISNALKFTTQGSITLKIAQATQDKNSFVVSVTDTGIGIPKEKQAQIFQAFTQADGSTSRKYGGTGLGLSISKELTYLLKGEIFLESADQEGSTFSIVLPSLQEERSEDNIETQSTLPKEHLIIDDRKTLGNNAALLIIDDDVPFSEIVYEHIKEHAAYALVAHNATDGLNLLHNYKVSGVILDLTLPDMDGIDVLKKIKNDEELKDIPVHIISSKDKDDATLKMGAVGYGQKPLLDDDIDGVISTLENFIKESTSGRVIEHEDTPFEDIDLSHLNVLVVDDDIKNIFVLDSALGDYDATVSTAYNGKEAIELLHKDETIDIILMDIMMPIMNGYEAIEAIREDAKLKNIPIIAITAKAMKEDRDKCIQIGADDFMSKPIDVNALVKLIKVWSDKKHR